MKNYYVYITTNPGRTVLYVGVTNNLSRRLSEHRENRSTNKTFTGRYYCYNLIYYEHFHNIRAAISREKEIKKWSRYKKESLINGLNPKWDTIIV
ncbi:MAG: GIY-YIG nuclease family protein [Chitinophagales bacterium]